MQGGEVPICHGGVSLCVVKAVERRVGAVRGDGRAMLEMELVVLRPW